MAVIDVGDIVPITVEILDLDQQPITTASVIAQVTLPDGTTSTPFALAPTGLGVYAADYTATVAGLHAWTATATGPVTGRWSDTFVVSPATGVYVSQAEALAYMKATRVITDPDELEQLRYLTRVACDAVERDLGVVLATRTITDVFDGGRAVLRLRKVPPRLTDGGRITAVSITEAGVTLSQGADYFLRRRNWALIRGAATAAGCWAPGAEQVEVTYTVSCNPIPEVARKVALAGVQRMWQQSQQMPHSYSDDSTLDAFSPAGVLTPLELSAYDSLRSDGIA